MPDHQLQPQLRHDLEPRHRPAARRLGQLQQLHRVSRRRHRHPSRLLHSRPRKQLQRRRRHHAQRALCADEEMLEIVTGIVLAQPAQPVPHAPIRQHSLDAQHQIAHHAVAQNLDAARIGRDQTTNHRHALRAQRQRKQPVMLRSDVLRARENNARLQRHGVIEHIHLAHLVHALQRDQHFPLRDRPVDHARIAALRIHGEAVFGAQRHRRRNFLGRSRLHQNRRRSLPPSPPVLQVRLDLVRIRGNALRPKRVREARDEGGNAIALIVSHDRHPECLPTMVRFSQVRR